MSRLAALADDPPLLEAEPNLPDGALRFLPAGLGLNALGRGEEARAAFERVVKRDAGTERAQSMRRARLRIDD